MLSKGVARLSLMALAARNTLESAGNGTMSVEEAPTLEVIRDVGEPTAKRDCDNPPYASNARGAAYYEPQRSQITSNRTEATSRYSGTAPTINRFARRVITANRDLKAWAPNHTRRRTGRVSRIPF